jgi:uncharacterized protein (DUF433 family)
MMEQTKSPAETEGESQPPSDAPNGRPSTLPPTEPTGEITSASAVAGSMGAKQFDAAPDPTGTKFGPDAWKVRLWQEIAAEHPRIQVDPAVMGGVPVIAGTRMPVYVIVGYAGGGFSPEKIVANFYDEISVADVEAAFSFASALSW